MPKNFGTWASNVLPTTRLYSRSNITHRRPCIQLTWSQFRRYGTPNLKCDPEPLRSSSWTHLIVVPLKQASVMFNVVLMTWQRFLDVQLSYLTFGSSLAETAISLDHVCLSSFRSTSMPISLWGRSSTSLLSQIIGRERRLRQLQGSLLMKRRLDVSLYGSLLRNQWSGTFQNLQMIENMSVRALF